MSSNSPFSQDSWIIGRSPECDLIVNEATVSSCHCRLTWNGQQYFVEDLHSPNGVYVAGERIPVGTAVPVTPGMKVTLGWQIAMPWPALPRVEISDVAGQEDVFTEDASAERVITIGRDPQSLKHFDLPLVSWHHARVVYENGLPILEDLGSRNGTFIGRMDRRIERAVLNAESDVYLGSYKVPARELLTEERVSIGESAYDRVEFQRSSMILGRDPQSDLWLNYPMISWHHARLTHNADGVVVEDLGSLNGTFVGGMRVTGKVLVRPGQEIALGSYRFRILEGGQLAQREYHGNLTIEAAGVTVHAPNGRRLIEPVSMTIFPSELVAVMGPAGAGKTTLLKALNGYTRPAEGRVLFNGDSLYDYYDRFRQQVGYVPQDDIVHPQLTVGEALYFSARLRTDLSDAEIRARTRSLLGQLGMLDKIDTRIGSPEQKTLSGGQRKQVNIALELINDTPVLFLDEPTSGLSSYDAEAVIRLLKNLARSGKTVITTIHQPSRSIYKQFDDLILVNRAVNETSGAMVYFGPAYPDSIQFFHRAENVSAKTSDANDGQGEELAPEMLLAGLAQQSTAAWMEEYRRSRYQSEFVEGRSGHQPAANVPTSAAKARRAFGMTQFAALLRRNTILKMRNRVQAAIFLLQAPLFAVLIALVYAPLRAANGFAELTPKLAGVHFLMAVAAIWFGCNNAAREIVGEWTVFRRERMVTLKLAPYVLSKLAVLFVLALVQCLSLLLIVHVSLGLKSNFVLNLVVLVLAAMVGAAMGICISALTRTTESAIALLPVVLLPVIALGGGMRPLHLIDGNYRWLTDLVPSRWAYEANLLLETGRSGWRRQGDEPAFTYLPDLSDPIQRSGMNVDAGVAAVACMREADEPVASAQAATVRGSDGKMHTILCSDVAEPVMPRYLLQWLDSDGTRYAVRAFQGEAKAVGNQRFVAMPFRHRLQQSIAVLGGMFAGLTLLCLGILWKRDYDPQ
jgi:ABC-type multidrug transport system ATPase subunit/pSer/pThr/pTyr-binding forkhead associated (FHA) protein/ABC-type multidrug transport system permease subunit